MQKSLSLYRAAAVLAALAAACGSNGGPVTNLHPVFYRTMSPAPVVTSTVSTSAGTLANATISYDPHALFDGWRSIGATAQATTNATGVASLALPQNTYAVQIQPAGGGPTNVGKFNTTLAVTGSMSPITLQTSQQTWTVTAPSAMSSIKAEIYQTDASGKLQVGTKTAPLDPLALKVVTNLATPATTATFTTELFPGTYRAVITASASGGGVISPMETGVFTAAGNAARESQPVTLSAGGNVLQLTLLDGAAATADIATVTAYDASTLAHIADAPYVQASSNATLNLGNVSNVIVQIIDNSGNTVGMSSQTVSGTSNVTMSRTVVSGNVQGPNAAGLTASSPGVYGSVAAYLTTTLGYPWDSSLATSAAVRSTITSATGTYSLKLFPMSFNLKAENLVGLPPTAPVALTAAGATMAGQNISASIGGIISGNLQDQSHLNVTGVPVEVFATDASHTRIATTVTDASGNFTIPVASGTYEVFVGGALSATPNVAAGNTTALTLTQFQITGRLIDATANPLNNVAVDWGGGSASSAALGTFTIKVVQGINWFLFAPSSAAIGFAFEPAVQVDSNTIKSL